MTNTDPHQDKLHQHEEPFLQSIHTNDETMIVGLHTCHRIEPVSVDELDFSAETSDVTKPSSEQQKKGQEVPLYCHPLVDFHRFRAATIQASQQRIESHPHGIYPRRFSGIRLLVSMYLSRLQAWLMK